MIYWNLVCGVRLWGWSEVLLFSATSPSDHDEDEDGCDYNYYYYLLSAYHYYGGWRQHLSHLVEH